MQMSQEIQKAMQFAQACGLLLNCELAVDFASLLPEADLSNVDDQTKRCRRCWMNEMLLNAKR
jgi:hypothetical protein